MCMDPYNLMDELMPTDFDLEVFKKEVAEARKLDLVVGEDIPLDDEIGDYGEKPPLTDDEAAADWVAQWNPPDPK